MNHVIAFFEKLFESVGLHLELCEVVLLLHALVAEEIEVLQCGSLRFVIEELKKKGSEGIAYFGLANRH